MGKRHAPRAGSLQFWPRKRAKKPYARIRSWSKLAGARILGFAGYKAGMTSVRLRDNSASTTKGQIISVPATIIECPPLKPLALKFYKRTDYGLKLITQTLSSKLDKELSRKIKLPKKDIKSSIPEKFDEIRLLVYTQPKLTLLPKKKPEIFELALGTNNLEFAKSLLEKEIKITEVFKEGQFLDIHAITKGKGYQGPVKRFGVRLKVHKSEKGQRRVGSLGPWHSRNIWAVPHAGQMGFHQRTEYNKLLLKISSNPEEINPAGGFLNYGIIKNDYILVKGSIPGSRKRLITFTESIRATKKPAVIEILNINLQSKQGK